MLIPAIFISSIIYDAIVTIKRMQTGALLLKLFCETKITRSAPLIDIK